MGILHKVTRHKTFLDFIVDIVDILEIYQIWGRYEWDLLNMGDFDFWDVHGHFMGYHG